MQAKIGKTTCPYCGVGCGVDFPLPANAQNEVAPVAGDENHPANFGKLCVKGSSLSQTLSKDGRLLYPMVNGERTSWDSAVSSVAHQINKIVEEHGPDAFAFYLSGQILTEDYYVANKLAKGFIGTANVDTNSRLCMASAVVGYKRAFGSDTVPCCYEDLELCDLLIMVGSNAAWTHPILYQRILAAKKQRPSMKVVVIDPRRTATCDIADLHLPITPGSDAFIYNYLLVQTQQRECLDFSFIESYTEGFESALEEAKQTAGELAQVAQVCGVPEDDLQQLADWWCSTEKSLSFYSQGVNQSATGVDKSNAIINCHLATGRIGREGMGPFSITGQPNAMGGREVGGLANQLAAHMDFATPGAIDLVQRFWQAPNMAIENGLKAVDLFQAIEAGKVKAVWIMSTNPMVSLPDTAQVQRALEKCELVIVSDCQAQTDTSRFADVLFPATGWSEKDGMVTNSERRISRQRGLLPAPGEARHDWQAICDVAKAMGFYEAFSYDSVHEIFAEHAALSAFENNESRDFDIGYYQNITRQEYDDFLPIQWPVTQQNPRGTKRMFTDGRFYTANKKAKFLPIKPALPVTQPTKNYPYVLNTGRVRDQWHTMTRTGKAASLLNHIDQPYVEMAEKDAVGLQLIENQVVKLASEFGHALLRVKVNKAQKAGQVFVPIHWAQQFASAAIASRLLPQVVDPLSGQPESKHGRVDVSTLKDLTYGFVVSSKKLNVDKFEYWCDITLDKGKYYEFAFTHAETKKVSKTELVKRYFIESLSLQGNVEWLEYNNFVNQSVRLACLIDGKLELAFYLSLTPELPDTKWLVGMLSAQQQLSLEQRIALLAGRPANVVDKGKVVCTCFHIGDKQIKEAIKGGCTSAAQLGEKLKCGTNCGSCVPELNSLLHSVSEEKAEIKHNVAPSLIENVVVEDG